MPAVDLQRALAIPPVPARSAVGQIVKDIEGQRGTWEDFALYLDFRSMGLPDVGYVAIPATISNSEEKQQPRHEIRFTLRARRSPDLFPTFTGSLGVDGAGPSSSQLWLAGEYDLPMRQLGLLFDQTIARGAAEKALNNMLSELAQAATDHVQQRERADVRYRLIFNSGD